MKSLRLFIAQIMIWMIIFLVCVNLGHLSENGLCAKTKIVRIGFLPVSFFGTNFQDAKLAMEVLFKTLSKRWGEDFEPQVSVYDDIPKMAAAMKKKELDLLNVYSYDYFTLQSMIPLDPIFVSSRGGSVYEKYSLLVHRDAKIQQLSDLNKKKIVIYTRGIGKTPLLWLDTILLRKEKCISRDFFSSVKEVDKVKHALVPVYFKQMDACIVTRRSFEIEVEQNPDIGRKLIIIEDSPELLTSVFCARIDFDKKQREGIWKTAISIHEDTEGNQILTILGSDKLMDFKPSYLHSINELIKENNRLKSGKSK